MTPRRKKKVLIITIIVILVLVLIGGFIALYLTTDMFKPNKSLFEKYISQNAENIEAFIGSNEESKKGLKQSSYNTKTELSINYAKGENTENKINNLKWQGNKIVDENDNYQYNEMKLAQGDENILDIKYVQNDDLYGIKINDIFEKYLAFENNNLESIYKNFGLNEEIIKQLPTEIDFEENKNMKLFTDEEIQNLQNKYFNQIINNKYSENYNKSNEQININGQNINTTAYSLSMTKEQINNIYIEILETVKQDELILEKVRNLENSALKYINKEASLEDSFKTKIDETITNIKNNNIGTQKSQFVVYQNNKQTVRTSIIGDGYEIDLDILNNTFMQIRYKTNEEEMSLQITKTENEWKANFVNQKQDDIQNWEISQNKEQDTNGEKKTNKLTIESGENKLEIALNEETKFTSSEQDAIKLDEKNSTIINDLKEEELKETLSSVQEKITGALTETLTKIDIDNIQKILENLGIVKSAVAIERTQMTENEKNRFNTQLEFFTGENVTSETVMELLEYCKNNLLGIEFPSNTELRLNLDLNANEDATLYAKIKDILVNDDDNVKIYETLTKFYTEDKGRNHYEIKINYNEETGLADNISIIIKNDEKQN